MTTQHILLSAAGLGLLLNFTACVKKNSELDAAISQHNQDANTYKAELDQTDSDINNVLRGNSGFNKLDETAGALSSPLCGCTIDSTDMAQKILYFNFDGQTPCFSPSRTRSGQIKVELISGLHWDDQGAVIRQTFTNYKITRMADNKSITFNGVKTLENVNGNNWLSVLLGGSILKYRERALGLAVNFDNGQQATWNSARITEWSYTPGLGTIKFKAYGDTALNSYQNVDSWGLNRYQQPFTTYYTQPVISDTYCGLWRFTGGELVHRLQDTDYTLTLGVNQNGGPSTTACAYGFKVSWTANGTSQSAVFSY